MAQNATSGGYRSRTVFSEKNPSVTRIRSCHLPLGKGGNGRHDIVQTSLSPVILSEAKNLFAKIATELALLAMTELGGGLAAGGR